MAGELIRPGVEVIQTFKTASPSFARPALVPCVVGPAYEVINVLNTDATINSKARYAAYTQIALTVPELSFPNPRGNIAELDVVESSIRPFMSFGGQLSELLMAPGESFLTASHGASKAAIQSSIFSGNTGIALNGKTLVLALDNPVNASTANDVTVTFTGTGNLTSAQAATQINTAVGKTVATVVGSSPNDKVQIASPTFGALSSVTIRLTGSANSLLSLGFVTAAWAEERVEGSGYRAQDDNNNDTLSPWIEFYVGDYKVNGSTTSFAAKAGLINVVTGTLVSAKATAVTYGTAGTIPLLVGDYVYADGARVKSGEITKVESTRFKIGTINAALSTADSNGRYTTKVYDLAQVGVLTDPNPFIPQYVWFKATGLDWTKVTPTAASLTGSVAGTAATAASVTGAGALAGPFAISGLTLHLSITLDGVTNSTTYTFPGATYTNMATVEAALATAAITGLVATDNAASPPQLILSTSHTGRLQSITVKSDGTANTILGFSAVSDTTANGTDVVFSGLATQTLTWTLSDNPHTYSVTFTDTSLDIAVADLNTQSGFTFASKDAAGTHLVLTSNLKGMAAKILVNAGTAATTLGLSTTAVLGTGRPFPDAYLDATSTLKIGGQIVRDPVTGFPADQATSPATLYIQYKGLRLDVSAVAKVAGVLRIPDIDTLSTVLDPLTEDNPLGLALFLCMINAPGLEVKALGVDEVTGGSPMGSQAAYARALTLLEAEEVYALAPLSQDEAVHGLFAAHCDAMSEPEQAGERIVFINKLMPTTKNPTIAASGTSANSTATSNQIQIDVNPASGLVSAGVNPAQALTVAMGVYLEYSSGSQLVRYNVSSVSGTLVNLNLTFTGTQNTDGFYTTSAVGTVVNAAYALKVRGASLAIPGTSRLDYSLVSSTVSDANATLSDRRVFSVFPDTIKTTVSGISKALGGYYASAAVVGMVASQPPQQGFTNFPVTGLTGVVGPEKFTKKQLNVMAGGGTYILVQEVIGGAVSCRHQLSTDLDSIEKRELSITKVVDFTAKFLRNGVKKYIGVQVINANFLDTIGTTVQGMLKFLEEAGVLNGASLNNIIQDTSAPDTILLDVTLDVPFPANYIKLTLVV